MWKQLWLNQWIQLPGWLATKSFEQASVIDVIHRIFCLELQLSFFADSVIWTPLKLGEFLLHDIAALQLKADLTLKKYLDQVCLFSNLITIPVQWCEFWVSVVGTELLLTGFKVGIFIRRWTKFQKRWGSQKGVKSNINRRAFFFFYQSKLLSHFVPISPEITLKERSLG